MRVRVSDAEPVDPAVKAELDILGEQATASLAQFYDQVPVRKSSQLNYALCVITDTYLLTSSSQAYLVR